MDAPMDAPICTHGAHGIKSFILGNEKYKGDAMLQKSYIADFLTKKQVINHGEIPQYYVSENHDAIKRQTPLSDPSCHESQHGRFPDRTGPSPNRSYRRAP